MDVAAVGPEIAMPFVAGACARYELPYDPESGGGVIWWAGLDRGMRAVMGWADGASPNEILVIGPFGDGSGIEDTWMHELLRSLYPLRAIFTVIPASPSLYIRRKSAQLERYAGVYGGAR